MLEKDQIRINYIISTIDKIFELNMNTSFHDFDNNFLLKVASERLLETIAEACNAMSPEFKVNNPEIQWNAIKGMRNIIVHEYFSINYKVVYDTIHNQMNPLKQQLLKSI